MYVILGGQWGEDKNHEQQQKIWDKFDGNT